MNIKDFVFDAVYQYFDTHNDISKEKFFSFIDKANQIQSDNIKEMIRKRRESFAKKSGYPESKVMKEIEDYLDDKD